MNGFIYKITIPNGKIYIGQTKNFKQRCLQHKCIPSDPKKMTLLMRNILKYGFENCAIEIIETCDFSQINERESFWIEKYQSHIHKYRSGNGLNLTSGGDGVKNLVHSEEARKKMSLLRKGIKKSQEQILKSAKSRTGLKRSEESKLRMTIAQTGRVQSESEKLNNSLSKRGDKNYFFGKKHTQEIKDIISKSVIKNHKEGAYEHRRIKMCTLLLNTQTGIYYYGFKEAAFSINKSNSCIRLNVLNKPIKKTGNSYRNLTSFIKV